MKKNRKLRIQNCLWKWIFIYSHSQGLEKGPRKWGPWSLSFVNLTVSPPLLLRNVSHRTSDLRHLSTAMCLQMGSLWKWLRGVLIDAVSVTLFTPVVWLQIITSSSVNVLKMQKVALETNLRPARINTSLRMWAVIRTWNLLKTGRSAQLWRSLWRGIDFARMKNIFRYILYLWHAPVTLQAGRVATGALCLSWILKGKFFSGVSLAVTLTLRERFSI